jgi:hypothetical protein
MYTVQVVSQAKKGARGEIKANMSFTTLSMSMHKNTSKNNLFATMPFTIVEKPNNCFLFCLFNIRFATIKYILAQNSPLLIFLQSTQK